MFAQKSKKGLISFLFVSMLLVLTSCSSDSPTSGSGGGVSSNANGSTLSSSSVPPVPPSSSSSPSNSSIAESSSSSEAVEGSSDSGEAGSSSSVVVGSSGSVTLSCTGLQASVEKGGTIAQPTLTCSDGSPATNPSWTGRPGNNGSWAVSATTNTASYTIGANATCGSVSNLTAACGTVTVGAGTSTSSSSVAKSSSSSVATGGGSSSSVAAAASSSSQASPSPSQRSWTNVDYAPTASRRHSRQRYDIKLPSSGNGPFPLLIYVHGGGFSGGDWQLAQNQNGLVKRANNNNYAVASVGYLLMGQSGWSGGQRAFPENVEDVLAAIRHLRANASTYHIDPDKFAVSGFSAGAYMTAIVCALSNATNHGYDITSLGNAGVSHAVQAAASSAALTDFSLLETHEAENKVTGLDHNTSPEGAMLGGKLTDNNENMKKNLTMQNPLTHISAKTPPIYMMHGDNDNLVPWQQSDIMVKKINSFVAGKAKFNKVSGRSHADFDGENDSKTIEILNFLNDALGVTR